MRILVTGATGFIGDEVARPLIAAAESGLRGPWPTSDDRATSWTEFFELVRQHYPRFRAANVPVWLARAGAALLRPIQRLSGRESLMMRGG